MSSRLMELAGIRAESIMPVFGLLIDTALKGSVLIAAAAIAAYLLRNRSAASRHAAWSAAVVGHLALPLLTLLVPQWRVPVLPAPPWLESAAVAAPVAQQKGPVSIGPSDSRTTATQPVESPTTPSGAAPSGSDATPRNAGPAGDRTVVTGDGGGSVSLLSMLAILWIAGSVVVLLRLAIGTWRVGRLAKNGDRVDDGEWLSLTLRLAKRLDITRPLTLLRGDSLAVPVTWGVVYPAVLLPPDANEWPEARRRFVLVHEMAHVKRFDALTQLIAQVTIAILWFDPLIWVAAHRMRVEREHACDDYVLRDGTVPSLYAGELLEMVQSIGSPRHDSAAPAFAALAMARKSEFEGRMLAILDPRQNRHTLGRTSAILASVALALLVLPLAALRPFDTESPTVAAATLKPVASAEPVKAPRSLRNIADTACDSVARTKRSSLGTSIHVHGGEDSGETDVLEYLNVTKTRCAQAVLFGDGTFANDRLLDLPASGYASFREMSSAGDRIVRIIPASTGGLEYIATLNGRRVTYDEGMRAWLGRFMPEVLREAAVNAPQRVARDLASGGVDLVLSRIDSIKSTASKRIHYEALLDGKPLSESDYARVARHASRSLNHSPSDLNAVLTLVAASPAAGTKSLGAAIAKLDVAQQAMGQALDAALDRNTSSTDSASTIRQYGAGNDPQMILLALQGAKEISSDTDKRNLLATFAPAALGRKNVALRTAYFDVIATIESDTDTRAVLTSAISYGQRDSAILFAIFKDVASHLTSDTDKRAVLTAAAEQRTLTTAPLREAFMKAARSIESSTDYTVVLQAAFKQ